MGWSDGPIPFDSSRSEPVNEGVTKHVGLCKRSYKKSKKIVDGNKIPTNVSIASLYNMSSHYKESVQKWKYIS